MEITVEFVNGIVVTFIGTQEGNVYTVKPKLNTCHEIMKTDFKPSEEDIKDFFMLDPAFRRAAGIE